LIKYFQPRVTASKGFHETCYDDLRKAVRDADVVECVDRSSGRTKVIHEDGLENPRNILRVPIDFNGDDIDQLATICLNEGKQLSDDSDDG
jgi:hypothetical protein